MAFKKPTVNTIKADIKNLSIYLRSTKKWGKSTLFRDVVIEKYGDPSRGLLIGCGNEIGYTMLDNVNATQVESYKDMIELKDWLIKEKGKEHNIEIVCFDTGDELCLLADKETIRQSNIENPNKKCKSIKAAFGGYTAGEKYSANDIIKPYMNDLKKAGFGVWCICHTKFKTIKEKGGLDEEGYMQLTSNLSADYESAFGDIFDVVLTGVIDRDLEEKKVGDKVKKYATDTVRKLYFRETPLIDAGGRFAADAVPEYMVFESGKNNAAEFIKVVEEGMEKSRTTLGKPVVKPAVSKKSAPVVEEPKIEIKSDPLPESFGVDEDENLFEENLADKVQTMFKECKDKELKAKARDIIKGYGKFSDIDEEGLKELYELLA